MKFGKFSVLTVAMAIVGGAYADAADTLISFSTQGPDKYADGATVVDGEWYALAWSADGVFEGITTDGKAIGDGDEVVVMAPLAKGGRCPFTVFQIDSSEAKSEGVYAVYLLDTRNSAKTAAATSVEGKPAELNGAIAAQSYTAASSFAGGATPTNSTAGAWAASEVDVGAEGFKQPKITAFKVDGANVEISVGDMMPGIKYNVKMGETPSNLKSYALEVPQTDDQPTFKIPAAKAKFFQIVREPLTK